MQILEILMKVGNSIIAAQNDDLKKKKKNCYYVLINLISIQKRSGVQYNKTFPIKTYGNIFYFECFTKSAIFNLHGGFL